jgi:hypothetical protein
VTGRKADVLLAAYTAGELAARLVRAGNKVRAGTLTMPTYAVLTCGVGLGPRQGSDVTAAVDKVLTAFHVKGVEGTHFPACCSVPLAAAALAWCHILRPCCCSSQTLRAVGACRLTGPLLPA